jgi:hypothetical protein
MSEALDEETKEALREMGPNKRATLRRWFADSKHYREFIAYIDALDGRPVEEKTNG